MGRGRARNAVVGVWRQNYRLGVFWNVQAGRAGKVGERLLLLKYLWCGECFWYRRGGMGQCVCTGTAFVDMYYGFDVLRGCWDGGNGIFIQR